MRRNGEIREIENRFQTEVEYIRRFVSLLLLQSTVYDRQVSDLNGILKRAHIAPLPTRPYGRFGRPYSTEEVGSLLSTVQTTAPVVYQAILAYERRLDDIPSYMPNGPALDYMDRLNEWVSYFIEQLPDDPEDQVTDAIIARAMREAVAVEEEWDESERIPEDALKDLLTTAVDHAIHAKVNQRLDDLVYAKQQLDEFEILARLGATGTEISILRQGFLLTMTAFDAAVFDLFRLGFKSKFFHIINAFGKNEKISYDDLASAGTFESFRDQVIESQLKRRYVKELLAILSSLGVSCVDEKLGDQPVQLTELILRRNLHIHNRGVVDARYLEPDATSGKPRYNLFGLKLGDLAPVDEKYFDGAIRLCTNCIVRIANWCDEPN